VLEALTAMGVDVACGQDKITVHAGNRPRPLDLIARPYPGIPTDLQAQFMSLLSLADGASVIADDVFPDRALHIAELNRLGARIERREKIAVTSGVHRLSGAEVTATDLRASAALVLAGLAASGETVIRHPEHLDRGYERLDQKLAELGAQVMVEGGPELPQQDEPNPLVAADSYLPEAAFREEFSARRPATRRVMGFRGEAMRA
jgi:UDP-N-acetylglucosamine 1-carboxyvinyltransferase